MDKQELLKTAKPILFNSEMVWAILDGRKTVTRRVIKPQTVTHNTKEGLKEESLNDFFANNRVNLKLLCEACAPYKKGDILYVRETWSFQSCDICGGKCGTAPPDCFKGEPGCYVYRTNYGTTDDDTFPPSMFTWRPSIHMPKDAARIFLKVTDVRVERLQDITEEQAVSEGVDWTDPSCADENWKPTYYDPDSGGEPNLINGFKHIWQSTIKKQDLDQYGWEANPWVWVYSFEVICHE